MGLSWPPSKTIAVLAKTKVKKIFIPDRIGGQKPSYLFDEIRIYLTVYSDFANTVICSDA